MVEQEMNPRILIIDDDLEMAKLLSEGLTGEGYHSKFCLNGESGLAAIKQWKPHLVLLDVLMPDMNGLDMLKTIRERDSYTSVILISGESNSETVVCGLDKGADDFLLKPFSMEELYARTRCQLRIRQLHEDLKQSNEQLLKLVETDELTGLYNMRAMRKKMDIEIERARRNDENICIMMLDMDKFKKINDSWGHVFGSRVLSRIGQILKENIRKSDVAARFGGDEFLIVMTGIQADVCQAIAEKILTKIREDEIQSNNYGALVSVSIGFVVLNPNQIHLNQEQLIREADRALYKAKDKGRNCYVYSQMKDFEIKTMDL